jgi:drug/metabolite transporter (DMT)-like permease
LTLIAPVLCTLWTWLCVADIPPRNSILGCAVILLALVASTIWKARAET